MVFGRGSLIDSPCFILGFGFWVLDLWFWAAGVFGGTGTAHGFLHGFFGYTQAGGYALLVVGTLDGIAYLSYVEGNLRDCGALAVGRCKVVLFGHHTYYVVYQGEGLISQFFPALRPAFREKKLVGVGAAWKLHDADFGLGAALDT